MELSFDKLLFVFTSAVTLFSAVAAMTKTKKDDDIAKWVKDVLARFVSLK